MRPKTARMWTSMVAIAVLLAGCGSSSDSDRSVSGISAADRAGTLISQRPLTNGGAKLVAAAETATYFRYISTAPDKSPIEVSGAVFLPSGVAPDGGWPVVAFAHGTSGVVSECAPTNSPILFGNDTLVAGLLYDRKAVVMTNYQGMDGPGGVPYLDTPSSGYNVLDSVRAAAGLGLPLSDEIVMVGLSQGGRATASAAETAETYAPELKILGDVLLSPALHVDLAGDIESKSLSDSQYLILPYLVRAVRYADSGFSYDKVLHGDLLAAAPRLEASCTGEMTLQDLAVGQSATAAEARFVSAEARRAFGDYETRGNLPKVGTDLPTYISRGDSDDLVETEWGNRAVAEMCRLGIPLQDKVMPGGHEAWIADSGEWVAWMNDRFAGIPAPVGTCDR